MTTAHETQEVRALDFVGVPRRRWRALVIVALIGAVVLAAFLSRVERRYVAGSTVLLTPITTSPFDASKSADQLINISTEARLASSASVAQAAAKRLGNAQLPNEMLPNLNVVANTGTTTLTIQYTAATPKVAAAGANAFAEAYLKERGEQAKAQQTSMLDSIGVQLKSLRAELKDVNRKIATSGAKDSAGKQNALSQRTLISGQINDLTTRENDLASLSVSPGSVVTHASPDRVTPTPNMRIYGAGGAIIVVVVALLVALARDRLDRRVIAPRDLERATGVPTLATLPYRAHAGLATLPSRSVDLLRSHVLAAGAKSVLFVDHGVTFDGSAVAALTAGSIARSGRAVTLVLPLAPSADLADVLAGLGASVDLDAVELTEVATGVYSQTSTRLTDLKVVSVRSETDEPGDVVVGAKFNSLLDAERSSARLLLMALPHTTDESLMVSLASRSDAVVLVAQLKRTNLSHLWDSAGTLASSPLYGSVLLRRWRGSLPSSAESLAAADAGAKSRHRGERGEGRRRAGTRTDA